MNTEEDKFPFKHTIQITLHSQFPQLSSSLVDVVKGFMGPWCTAVKVVKINDCGKEYTTEELNPLSDEYVGHIIALSHGVKCCCNRSADDCPYHGR
jgi:hypothetical protein